MASSCRRRRRRVPLFPRWSGRASLYRSRPARRLCHAAAPRPSVPGEFWWALRDSNPRPQPCESLPASFGYLGLPRNVQLRRRIRRPPVAADIPLFPLARARRDRLRAAPHFQPLGSAPRRHGVCQTGQGAPEAERGHGAKRRPAASLDRVGRFPKPTMAWAGPVGPAWSLPGLPEFLYRPVPIGCGQPQLTDVAVRLEGRWLSKRNSATKSTSTLQVL